ncbi:hypothetical protein [uncultured Mediterranean phage uvMED]|nr:hypothetical protein [uncultured Mediterranean phage uvMED]
MTNQKTHFRRVYKSDHLSSADLEDYMENGHKLIFKVSHCRQEFGAKVAGKKIDCNVAYFEGNVKPLVLNATNAKTMKQLTGSAFLEDWSNIHIQLYIDKNVKFAKEVVEGVRISPFPPKLELSKFDIKSENLLRRAVKVYLRDGNFTKIEERFILTEDDKAAIKEAAKGESND